LKLVKQLRRFLDLTVFQNGSRLPSSTVQNSYFNRDPFCISVPNSVKIGQINAEVSRFFDFQDGHHHHLRFSKTQNFNIWSALRLSSNFIKLSRTSCPDSLGPITGCREPYNFDHFSIIRCRNLQTKFAKPRREWKNWGCQPSKTPQPHTHPFNGPFSRTTQVSRYQKGKTSPDFTEARDSEWQWHQLGHIQVCTSLQTDNHTNTPPLCFLQAGCPSCRPTNSVKALKASKTPQPIKQN